MEYAPSLAVTHCPQCKTQRLATKDSRAHFAYGFLTVRRKRLCLKCGFKTHTIELPQDVSDSVFMED